MLRRDQRTHLAVGFGAGADLDRRDALGDLRNQLVGDRLRGEHDADRHASLAGRAVAGTDRRVGRHVDVGVGQHEHVVLGAAERLDPLAVRGPGLVDVLGDRGGTDEADRGDVVVLEDRVDGHLVALHDVEASGGEAGLREQFGEEQRDRRILLRRLQHERVAARERVGEHPHRDHRREVERGDPRDDAERLADRVDVDPAGGLLGVVTLDQLRDAAGELDVLETAGDLAHRIREHLAVLGGDERGDLLAVRVDQLAESEHHLGTLRQRRRAPCRERCPRRGDRGVDLVDGCEIHDAGLFTRRRVEHRRAVAGRRRDDPAIDPMRDGLHGNRSFGTDANETRGLTPRLIQWR